MIWLSILDNEINYMRRIFREWIKKKEIQQNKKWWAIRYFSLPTTNTNIRYKHGVCKNIFSLVITGFSFSFYWMFVFNKFNFLAIFFFFGWWMLDQWMVVVDKIIFFTHSLSLHDILSMLVIYFRYIFTGKKPKKNSHFYRAFFLAVYNFGFFFPFLRKIYTFSLHQKKRIRLPSSILLIDLTNVLSINKWSRQKCLRLYG